jgi:hypothetical protein
MPKAWCKLPNGKKILLKRSIFTGSLRVCYEGKEIVCLKIGGGKATFNIDEIKVEVEKRLVPWGIWMFGAEEVTVRANENIVFKRRFL